MNDEEPKVRDFYQVHLHHIKGRGWGFPTGWYRTESFESAKDMAIHNGNEPHIRRVREVTTIEYLALPSSAEKSEK